MAAMRAMTASILGRFCATRSLPLACSALELEGEHCLRDLLGPTSSGVSNRHGVLFIDVAEVSDVHITPSIEPRHCNLKVSFGTTGVDT